MAHEATVHMQEEGGCFGGKTKERGEMGWDAIHEELLEDCLVKDLVAGIKMAEDEDRFNKWKKAHGCEDEDPPLCKHCYHFEFECGGCKEANEENCAHCKVEKLEQEGLEAIPCSYCDDFEALCGCDEKYDIFEYETTCYFAG